MWAPEVGSDLIGMALSRDVIRLYGDLDGLAEIGGRHSLPSDCGGDLPAAMMS
jgi:hypothetical protein